MAIARGRRPQDQMEIDEIDSMLGDDSVYGSAKRGIAALKPGPAEPKPGPAPTGGVDLGDGTTQFTGSMGSGMGVPRSTLSNTGAAARTGARAGAAGGLGLDLGGGETRAGSSLTDLGTGKVAAPDMGPEGPEATTPGEAGPALSGDVPLPPGASAGERYGTGNIPGAENVEWGDVSRLRGFNTAEWGAGGTEGYEDSSIKNTFGKIASRYDPRAPNATQQILNDPDFKRFFPEAKIVPHPKGDLIDFGDGQPVDVLINAREGGAGDAWAFQVSGAAGAAGGSAGAGGAGGGNPETGLPTQGTDASTLADVMAILDEMAKGGENPMLKKALDELLSDVVSPELSAKLAPSLKGSRSSETGFFPGTASTGRRGGVL